jgi:hypothetical protein
MQQWLKRKDRFDDYHCTPPDNLNNGFCGDAVENVEITGEFLEGQRMGSENDFLATFAENENTGAQRTSSVGEI